MRLPKSNSPQHANKTSSNQTTKLQQQTDTKLMCKLHNNNVETGLFKINIIFVRFVHRLSTFILKDAQPFGGDLVMIDSKWFWRRRLRHSRESITSLNVVCVGWWLSSSSSQREVKVFPSSHSHCQQPPASHAHILKNEPSNVHAFAYYWSILDSICDHAHISIASIIILLTLLFHISICRKW